MMALLKCPNNAFLKLPYFDGALGLYMSIKLVGPSESLVTSNERAWSTRLENEIMAVG
jgi:hypothetical protein